MSFEIIDFHTHPFLRVDDCICKYKDTTPMSAQQTAKDLLGVGISRFCGSVIGGSGEGFARIAQNNADAYALQETHSGAYLPGIQIHADFVDESCRAIDEALARGGRLVGELVPATYGWSYGDEGFRKILDHASGKGLVFSLHTMVSEELERLLAEYPDVTFVLAHPGEQKTLFWHIEQMKKNDHVYLDLSGTGLFRFGMLSKLVSEVGAERILFGSDYPVCNAGMYVGGVLAERIPDDAKEKIFAGNAKRLLKL